MLFIYIYIYIYVCVCVCMCIYMNVRVCLHKPSYKQDAKQIQFLS